MSNYLKRFFAFLIDFVFVGALVYFSLEPFYPAQERYLSDSIFIEFLSVFVFIFYLFLTMIIYRTSVGLKIFKLKLETKQCIFMVTTVKIILLPFYILNLIYYPIRKSFLQDDITNSKIK